MATACADPDHPEGTPVSKNTDCRISTTLPGHPKMKKMLRRLGPGGPLGIIYLFIHAAANRPDGDLGGMTNEDIELAVDWDGEEGAFVKAAAEVRFLDGVEGHYRIHDWEDHQPWATGSEDRSLSGRWAAFVKRYGREGAAMRMPEYAARLRSASDPHPKRRKSDSEPDAPSPSPTDSFTDSDTKAPPTPPEPPPAPKARKAAKKRARAPVGAEAYSPGFERFWEAYPSGKRSKKTEAWAVWQRDDMEEFTDTIVTDVRTRAARHWGWIKEAGRFIPGAQVYLNGRRWNDDIEEPPAVVGRRSAIEHSNAERADRWANGDRT